MTATTTVVLAVALLAQPKPDETKPLATVKSPAEVDPGDLLRFDATGSRGEHRTWQVHWYGGDASEDGKRERIKQAVELLESENYSVTAPQGEDAAEYDVVDDGFKLYVPSKPGRQYVVFFSTANAAGIDSTMVKASVRDDSPRPPPPPPPPPPDDDDDDGPPPPPPPPPLPPTNWDLGKQALEWLRCVPMSARNEVLVHPTTGERTTRQRAIGRVYREVGDVTGELGSIVAADQMLAAGLQPAFGSRANEWRQFAAKADAALKAVITAGANPAQYGQALRSIGVALEQ